MNPNENNTASKKGLIVGVIALAVVIGLAVFFYNKGSNISTDANKNVIDEIAKAKEEADKYENNENPGNSTESTDTTVDKEDAGTADEENAPIPAPDFTVYTEDKTPIRFTDMLGKPVIINFWATWCGPCKKEMPHFEKAYKEYGDKIEFMMINPTDGANDTHESVNKFLKDNGYTFPVYRDTESDAVMKYGISAFPTTFFINSDGYLLGYYPGTMSEETLYACIDIVMGKTE